MQTEHRELLKQQAEQGLRSAQENAAALAAQRKELVVEAEQAENRLMVILDQERQSAKEAAAQLTEELSEITDKT